MPTYQSLCLKCNKKHEFIAQVAYRNDTPICCGNPTERRIFDAPVGHMDFQSWEPYESPASGKIITSKKERQEDFKRTKTRQYEGREQETKEAARQKAYAEIEEDKKLTKAAEKAYMDMPEVKKKQLEKIATAI
jgi:hypothetical protein